MLKYLALKLPQIRKIATERDRLRSERDALQSALQSERDLFRSERDALQAAASQSERAFQAERETLNAANTQLTDALKHANVLPIPPRHLQVRVVGGYSPHFLASATCSLEDFDRILETIGRSLSDFNHVLDLGVGCGRVLRRFHELYPQAALTGADIDAEAIAWLDQNYAPAGRFVALPDHPPSKLESDSFDLVYAISVFTHLNEQMQFEWLGELHRVTKSGGYLLLTAHGKSHHGSELVSPNISSGFYYNEDSGLTDGLPEFYRNAYHTRSYIEREWSRFFEILQYEEDGCEGHQDLILCQKR